MSKILSVQIPGIIFMICRYIYLRSYTLVYTGLLVNICCKCETRTQCSEGTLILAKPAR